MTVKEPQLIKGSLRVLNGKAQLYPNDITVIHQALIDVSDNLIDLNAKLTELETRSRSDT
jgi:hypothetical protein